MQIGLEKIYYVYNNGAINHLISGKSATMPRPKKIATEELCAISIRLPVSLKDEIQKLADDDERSLNLEVVRLLRLAVEQMKRSHPVTGGSPSPQ